MFHVRHFDHVIRQGVKVTSNKLVTVVWFGDVCVCVRRRGTPKLCIPSVGSVFVLPTLQNTLSLPRKWQIEPDEARVFLLAAG